MTPSGPYIAEPHDASDPVLRESSVLDQLRLNDTGLAETVTIQSLDGTIEVVSTTIGSDSLVLTSAMQAELNEFRHPDSPGSTLPSTATRIGELFLRTGATAPGMYKADDLVGAWTLIGSGSGGGDDLVFNINDYGALTASTAIEMRDVFEDAVQAAYDAGGGVVYVQPRATPYLVAIKDWPRASPYTSKGCIRLLAGVELFIPSGATIKMADNQDTGTPTAHVVLMYGPDTAVRGTGTINGNATGQSGATGGYYQGGPGCVAAANAPAENQCHRGFVGAGDEGYLKLENCFGNVVSAGGTISSLTEDFAVIGVDCDNCGEGPEFTYVKRGTHGRIISRDTNEVMAGDMCEMSACQDCTIYDIRSISKVNPAGSGYDLFGCQRVSMRNIHTTNCNVAIHDYGPVSPCEDVDASQILIIYEDGGNLSVPGFNVKSEHVTLAPKNIRIQGSVISPAGTLSTGISIGQVVVNNGGPYYIDLFCDNVRIGLNLAAPRVIGNLRLRRTRLRGVFSEAGPIAATGVEQLNLYLDMFDSTPEIGAKDVQLGVNSTSPSGFLGGNFTGTNFPDCVNPNTRISGTPTAGQVSEWVDAKTIKGVSANGTGLLVRTTSPIFVSPNIAVATGTSLALSSFLTAATVTTTSTIVSSTAIRAGVAGSVGTTAMVNGDASNTGYIEWKKANNTRTWYVGYDSGNNLTFTSEQGGLLVIGSAVRMPEITDPAAPSANTGVYYFRDNGSGKTQFCVRFPTGAVQVIATEP